MTGDPFSCFKASYLQHLHHQHLLLLVTEAQNLQTPPIRAFYVPWLDCRFVVQMSSWKKKKAQAFKGKTDHRQRFESCEPLCSAHSSLISCTEFISIPLPRDPPLGSGKSCLSRGCCFFFFFFFFPEIPHQGSGLTFSFVTLKPDAKPPSGVKFDEGRDFVGFVPLV